MRRFHVHLSVDDIATSTAFYSNLFGAPDRIETDYVKWMLEDPRINFAISKRGAPVGLNHLGMQVDTDEELQIMQGQLEAADIGLVAQPDSSCCYAKSDKYWVTDPQGIAFETYHTLGSIPLFGAEPAPSATEGGCCVPGANATSASCGPKSSKDCCA